MAGPIEEFLFYGDDIVIGRLPENTRMIYANPPENPIAQPRSAVRFALDHPLGKSPLEEMIRQKSRVTIAFDDPCVPVPLPRNDPRGLVIREILARLEYKGVPRDNIRLVCANGLHRKWTLSELAPILGKDVIRHLGRRRILCHDGTDPKQLVHLGQTAKGAEVEVNHLAVSSDVLIYVNLNFTTMNGGWKSLLVGLGSWKSIRHHHTPVQWNGKVSLLEPDKNPMHVMLREMSLLVRSKVNLFQIECVVNNQMWTPAFSKLLAPLGTRRGGSGPGIGTRTLLSMARRFPDRAKRLARDRLKADYRLTGIHAGDTDRVHQKTLEMVTRQQNVAVDKQADILVIGVPNLSPYAVRSIQNPILLRSLALGYLAGAFTGRPLVREGGVVIALNPGIARFHKQHHPSYKEFWETDLPLYFDPELSWNALSERYAMNPEYVHRYRHDYAYHGAHSLMNWMWGGMALRRLSAVYLAGAQEPQTAYKMGFIPAKNLDHALKMAQERTGPHPDIACQVIPPLFAASVA